jgi:hypothetical protein
MSNAAHILGATAILGVIVAYALFVLAAVVSVLRSPLSGGMKLVWFVFVWVAPFVGSLLWFLIGRGNATRYVR